MGLAALFQQALRNHDGEIVDVPVGACDHAGDHGRLLGEILVLGKLDDDLVQFVLHRFPFVLGQKGLQRDVDVVVHALDLDAFEFVPFQKLVRQHSHHGEPERIDLHRLSQRRIQSEELAAGRLPQDTDLVVPESVSGEKERAFHQFQIGGERVTGVDSQDPRVRSAHRRGDLVGLVLLLGIDSGPGRKHLPQGLDIVARQARRILTDDAEFLFLECLGPDQDIPQPHLPDQRQSFPSGPGPDGEHRQDGGHAEDHAQHGQRRAELVQQQVGKCDLDRLGEEHALKRGRNGAAECSPWEN